MFDITRKSQKHQPAYEWRPQSTYIRRPPIGEGALAGEASLNGQRQWRCWVTTSLTRNHLSPSNAIMPGQRRRRLPAQDGGRSDCQLLTQRTAATTLTAQRRHLRPTPKLLKLKWCWKNGPDQAGLAARASSREARHTQCGKRLKPIWKRQAAAYHYRRCGLRSGFLTRLGGQRACGWPAWKRIARRSASSASTAPSVVWGAAAEIFWPGTTRQDTGNDWHRKPSTFQATSQPRKPL